MELSGAEIVVRCLQEEGVEYVFGYPGGAVLHHLPPLYRPDRLPDRREPGQPVGILQLLRGLTRVFRRATVAVNKIAINSVSKL